MRLSILLALTALMPGLLVAAPLTLSFQGVVVSSTGLPAAPSAGSGLTGSFTIDDDAAAYGPHPFLPPRPTWEAHVLQGPPYGGVVEAAGLSLAASRIVIEVLDNDLNLVGIGTPGDLVVINASAPGRNVFLLLQGPVDSFTGTQVPDAAVLGRLAASAHLEASSTGIGLGAWSFRSGPLALNLPGHAVPEPASGLLLAAAALAAGAAQLHGARKAQMRRLRASGGLRWK